MTPDVSIFVQVYNAAPFVAECLKSVLALEDAGEMEVIVIDDASTDDSAAIIETFHDPRIRFIRHQTNQGAARTLNEGISRCQGEFVARIDADDRYRPEFLREMLGALQRSPQAGAAYGCIAMMDSEGAITSLKRHPALPSQDESSDRLLDLLDDHFITAPALIARRQVWLRAVPVPEKFQFCDWYCALRMAQAAPLTFRDAIVADYRVHPGGMHAKMVMDRSGERVYREVLDLFFAEPDHAVEKASRKNRIYGRRYARLGDEYFGAGMMLPARACYLTAFRYSHRLVAQRGLARRFVATFLGRKGYDAMKRAWRSWPSRERARSSPR